MKMKNRSHRYNIKRLTNIVNIKIASVWTMFICTKQHLTFEGQFMKKLRNTEVELKKELLIKKACKQWIANE